MLTSTLLKEKYHDVLLSRVCVCVCVRIGSIDGDGDDFCSALDLCSGYRVAGVFGVSELARCFGPGWLLRGGWRPGHHRLADDT